MNYLAHALLSEPDSAGLAGAIIGDFVKGLIPPDMDAGLARAVRLHRKLDSLSDAHRAHRRSRRRFSAKRRRYAGIIVDVSYDHFLAQHWNRYGTGELDHFTARVYASLDEHRSVLPPRLWAIAPRMASQDWLGSYGSLETVGRALDGIARRFKRETALPGAIAEVEALYGALERDFETFFPDMRAEAARWRQLLLAEPPLPGSSAISQAP
ncbi:MAG: ACP phosphodiesterase [Gammaproteobacteria bacterium]